MVVRRSERWQAWRKAQENKAKMANLTKQRQVLRLSKRFFMAIRVIQAVAAMFAINPLLKHLVWCHHWKGRTTSNGGQAHMAAKSLKKALCDAFRPVLSLRRRISECRCKLCCNFTKTTQCFRMTDDQQHVSIPSLHRLVQCYSTTMPNSILEQLFNNVKPSK
jgi:hypothetical protein